MKTCFFSGHRVLPEGIDRSLSTLLRERISDLCESGVTEFICGGAMGFDRMAAEAVLHLRDCWYPRIKLILLLPYPDQSEHWPAPEQDAYREILRQADQVHYTAEVYFPGCFHLRNQQMADRSDCLICYCREDSGGTAETIKYAKKKGLPIANLAELIPEY